ncbi:hypothetical protein Bca101_056679 [Brassica carinata]
MDLTLPIYHFDVIKPNENKLCPKTKNYLLQPQTFDLTVKYICPELNYFQIKINHLNPSANQRNIRVQCYDQHINTEQAPPPAKYSHRRRRWEAEPHRKPATKLAPSVDNSDGVKLCVTPFSRTEKRTIVHRRHFSPPNLSPSLRKVDLM